MLVKWDSDSELLFAHDRFFEALLSLPPPTALSKEDFKILTRFLLGQSPPDKGIIQNHRAIPVLFHHTAGLPQEFEVVRLFQGMAQSTLNLHEMHRGRLLLYILDRLTRLRDSDLRAAYLALFKTVATAVFSRSALWRSVTVLADPNYATAHELLEVFSQLLDPQPPSDTGISAFFAFGSGRGSPISLAALPVPHHFTVQFCLRVLESDNRRILPFVAIELVNLGTYSFGAKGEELWFVRKHDDHEEAFSVLPLSIDQWHAVSITFQRGGMMSSRQIKVCVDNAETIMTSYPFLKAAATPNRFLILHLAESPIQVGKRRLSCDISIFYVLESAGKFYPTSREGPDEKSVICQLDPMKVHGRELRDVAPSCRSIAVDGKIVTSLESFQSVFVNMSTIWNFIPLFRRLSKGGIDIQNGKIGVVVRIICVCIDEQSRSFDPARGRDGRYYAHYEKSPDAICRLV
jgi:hypothetical protein